MSACLDGNVSSDSGADCLLFVGTSEAGCSLSASFFDSESEPMMAVATSCSHVISICVPRLATSRVNRGSRCKIVKLQSHEILLNEHDDLLSN